MSRHNFEQIMANVVTLLFDVYKRLKNIFNVLFTFYFFIFPETFFFICDLNFSSNSRIKKFGLFSIRKSQAIALLITKK